jgi:CRISPR-associated endonuclease/helicase Cas3
MLSPEQFKEIHSPVEPNTGTDFAAWAKLKRDETGRTVDQHSLLDHMIDVAACFEALARTNSLRHAREVAAGRTLDEIDLARLTVIACLHDLGKANAGFQAKYWLHRTDAPASWPMSCGHGSEAWMLFASPGSIPRAQRILRGLPISGIATWGEVTFDLMRASISHHGRPVDVQPTIDPEVWAAAGTSPGTQYDPAKAIDDLGAFVESHYKQAFQGGRHELPNTPAFVHLFGGLVQLADWLGSDTRPNFFPYSVPGEDRASTAPHRASHAVRAIGIDASAFRGPLVEHGIAFSQAFNVPSPRPMQEAMAGENFGQVVILEAETGSGKTEAALWRFLTLFRAGQVDALYFALPTRVAASQLYSRIMAFVGRVWPEAAPVVVRALPGYEAADGEAKIALPEFRVQWSDRPEDAEAERRWSAESPKRFLAATIAVGTIDQALLSGLLVKHAHLRQSMLARSLLVVDEVHASDAYMTVLLERLLQAHQACGGHAVLLSATLGAAARVRYLAGPDRARMIATPSLSCAIEVPYPSISSRTAQHIRTDAVGRAPRHKAVDWQTWDAIDDPHAIAQRAVLAAKQGARVLVIRNTVPAAVATLRAAEELTLAQGGDWLFQLNGINTLHHSRFSRDDRPLLDRQVELDLGKVRTGSTGRLVIGTQTLEQSLDIDADLLITDLCPMDVLLQRIGRLHRHERPSADWPDDCRPVGFETARAWVLTPAGGDLSGVLKRARHGLGPLRMRDSAMQGVYIDVRTLEATRRLIDGTRSRTIPQDNRFLVEQATHPEALALIEQANGPEWARFGQEYEGSIGAKMSLGRHHALPFDMPYGDLVFPDSEQAIATRLGASDRLVVFDDPLAGPFGTIVRSLTLRHHQIPSGLAFDAKACEIELLSENAGFEFNLGVTRFRYSRLGIERLMQSNTTKDKGARP